jgi:alpha/beta superfamily hydrolase
MKRVSIVAGSLFFVSYWLGCGIKLDDFVLKPSTNFRHNPEDLGYAYEEKLVGGKDGLQISLWHIRAAGNSRGTIVVVPGNDSNKGRYTVALPIFVDKGFDMVLFDYPGFGKSPGTPSFQALLDGARAAFDYAFEEDDVVIGLGISLGTNVLARVAADYPELKACIFESTTNVWEISSAFLEYHRFLEGIGGIADLVAAGASSPDYDMKQWVAQLKMHKLFIHSPNDSVTPFSGAMDVFLAAAQPRHMFVTQGNHTQQLFIDPVLYRSVLIGWIDGVLRTDPIANAGFQQFLDTEFTATLAEYGLTEVP